MAFEIIRFKQFARDVLTSGNIDSRSGGRDSTRRKGSNEETIRQYLEREGYSDTFRDNYIIPMAASIWTIRPDGRALAFPAVDFIRRLYVCFLLFVSLFDQLTSYRWDIGLLSPRSSGAEWLTIRDGSRAYIDAVMRGFPSNHRFLRTAVRAVVDNDDGRVRLHLDGGSSPIYDHVILAVPGDEAYALVEGSATPEEKQILSQFRTSTRTAVLHGDVSLMPRSRKAWSSWTCTTQSYPGSNTGEPALVSMTYNMNLLLQIPTEVFGNVLLTLDPLHEPNPRTVQGRYNYRQGVDDANTIRAQQRLGRIQNTRGISYAGAWTSNGSLEDGFSSGLRVAQEHLGARLPFRLSEPGSGPDDRVGLGVADLALRLVALIIQVFVFEMFDRVVGSYRAGKTSRRPHVNGLSASIKKKAF
jgi:predicted NAD/FAD-binding protein